uniref:Uncharacterized protein n=1 Tax=Nelumbo nucifera TaxID=4432 RepID=A0A822YBU3_NELNU|nr:TPA_asm: hypothetical protein HUJ06_029943 [Nelumbo nucifera]
MKESTLTYFQTNKFIYAFQEIVDAYGDRKLGDFIFGVPIALAFVAKFH